MKNLAKHIPNTLTMCRFVLIPFIFVSIINEQFLVAFIFLTISGLTDVLDGFIARKFNFITNFGKLIDPLADKTTQIATLIALSYIGIIPMWILIVVFAKEALMIAGASFLYGKELVVSSRWFGKLATVLFYVAIVCSFIIKYFSISVFFDLYIYYIALIFTIFALIMYYREFFNKGYMNKEELKAENKEIITKPHRKLNKANKKNNIN